MSGMRQHFIPRFLQEGFASHKTGDEVFTWVYRKDRPPFNTNIINVGVEGLFYTDEEGTTADDLITKEEGPLSIMVQELRNSNPGGISDPRVPELIAHLDIRTRHIRQAVMLTGSYGFSRILDFVGDQDFFVSFLERRLQNDPSMLRESVLKELLQKGLPRNMLEPIMRMAKPLIPHFMAQIKPMLPKIAAELRRVLIEKLPKWAKSSVLSLTVLYIFSPLQE
jgi:hypothetical protein